MGDKEKLSGDTPGKRKIFKHGKKLDAHSMPLFA